MACAGVWWYYGAGGRWWVGFYVVSISVKVSFLGIESFRLGKICSGLNFNTYWYFGEERMVWGERGGLLWLVREKHWGLSVYFLLSLTSLSLSLKLFLPLPPQNFTHRGCLGWDYCVTMMMMMRDGGGGEGEGLS